MYLLECLQKTPPPVLVFCENKSDVDDIHEYILLKCVDAVSIHGGKSQVAVLSVRRMFSALRPLSSYPEPGIRVTVLICFVDRLLYDQENQPPRHQMQNAACMHARVGRTLP